MDQQLCLSEYNASQMLSCVFVSSVMYGCAHISTVHCNGLRKYLHTICDNITLMLCFVPFRLHRMINIFRSIRILHQYS